MPLKKKTDIETAAEQTVKKPVKPRKQAPVTYDSLVSKLAKKYNGKKVKLSDTLTAQIRILGEAEGTFYLQVQEGILTIMPFDYVNADLNIIVSCENCVKLLNKTLDFESAVYDSTLVVYGDLGKMLALKNLL